MKRNQVFKTHALVMILASSFLAACSMENEDDRKLAAGMACIDEAKNEHDADLCLQKVEGLTSKQSYLIRCSANMIAQGFTGTRVAKAFQELKDNEGNKTAAMMSYLVFAKNLPNHTADKTLENCSLSGVNSVKGLASMIKTATFAAELANGGSLEGTPFDPSNPDTFEPEKLKEKLEDVAQNAGPEEKQEFGNLAIIAHESYCHEGSSMKDQDVCTKLSEAIEAGGGDPETIGQKLLDLLKQK